MQKEREKSARAVSQPPAWIYFPALAVFRLAARLFFGLRIRRDVMRTLQGPCFVVYNHTMLLDFGVVAAVCRPKRLNFVVSTHFFHSPTLAPLLRWMRCIPKRPFVSDLTSIRQMVRVVKAGGSVAIAPEGQISCSGTNSDIDPNIGALAKMLGVQVVNVKLNGSYLARPKWGGGRLYPARAEATAELVYTAEQVKQLPADELAEGIIAAMQFDDYAWARENCVQTRRRRLVEGLENVLTICPVCCKKACMRAEGQRLFCEQCGYSVVGDNMGLLHREGGGEAVFDTPSAWYRWQGEQLRKELRAGTLLPLHSSCRFVESGEGAYDEGGYAWTGRGEITLNETGLHYTGTRSGEPFSYDTSPATQRTLPHSGGVWVMEAVGSAQEQRDFGFAPDDTREMMLYVQSWPALREQILAKRAAEQGSSPDARRARRGRERQD